MLNLNDVTVRVAGRPLLENATMRLPAGTRMGLVGRNGSGKSTLLRLIAGEVQPDQGTLRLQSGASFGMVAQEAPGGEATPLATVLAADRELTALHEELLHADPSRIAEIHDRMAALGAGTATARAASILKGLGFDEAMQAAPMSSFSGGWRMRVALASVLFVEPDLLLLDEPTNHLDLEATMWLEDYLRRYPRTLLVVSHDRDLLNAVPEKICHLEQRKLTVYNGAYDTFARTRAERIILQEKARAKQDAERAHIQSFVDRFRYKASKARQAQSRIKLLEKMKEVAVLPPEPEVEFHFPLAELPAPPLVTMDGVRCGYGDRVILDRLDLRLDPDDRIALLGANGNGKSTFAKLVAGRLQPMTGECVRARGLRVGFFAQHQIEDLVPDQSGLAHLRSRLPQAREQEHRARLARFGLGADKAETPAKHLSGGEKTRLAMVLMCLDSPQILILDEPTNHLDIDSREALVEALNDYPGAVLLISHDRHLVELVADRLWLVANGRVAPYEGDLDDYRAMLLATSAETRTLAPGEAPKAGKMAAAERRALLAPLRQRAKEAEREVERLTGRLRELEAKLADPATYANGSEVAALQKEAARFAARIAAAEARWLEAEGEVERVEAA